MDDPTLTVIYRDGQRARYRIDTSMLNDVLAAVSALGGGEVELGRGPWLIPIAVPSGVHLSGPTTTPWLRLDTPSSGE